ncbi:MAG: NUDIX domain-containing protein [bacterium]|nr:NUDIX domain-containing protein [bacterium]
MEKGINEQLMNYLRIFPDEEELLSLLKKQVLENQDILNRKNFEGHITASGLVISSDKKVLVVFHNKLQKFLQPGGHIEKGDEDLMFSAMRELREETNLSNVELCNWCPENNSPIMIDTHKIPENKQKNEYEHYHHDFMFIFTIKKGADIILDTNEVSNFRWISIDEIIKTDSVIAKGLKKATMLNII